MTGTEGPPPVGGIHEAALYVADLERAAAFYRVVFGFEEIGRDPRRHVFLRAGRDVLLLFDADTTRDSGGSVPPHGAAGEQHVAFDIAPNAIAAWRAHLVVRGVPIEAEVSWPRGGRSLYVRDPDRHSVELVTRGVWDRCGSPPRASSSNDDAAGGVTGPPE